MFYLLCLHLQMTSMLNCHISCCVEISNNVYVTEMKLYLKCRIAIHYKNICALKFFSKFVCSLTFA